jgi:Ca2+-binding EF-hand superfamily protein
MALQVQEVKPYAQGYAQQEEDDNDEHAVVVSDTVTPRVRKRDIVRRWLFQKQASHDSLAKEMKLQSIELNNSFSKEPSQPKTGSSEAKEDAKNEHEVSDIIKMAFVQSDKDSSGGLDRWELYDALNKLDYDVTPEICQALLEEFDTNKNGYLELQELASLVNNKVSKDVGAVFAMYANERDGLLTTGALRRALELMGVDMNAKKTKSLLVKYDRNGDAKLGLLGFADLVASSPTAQFWLAVDKSGAMRKVRANALNKLTRAPKKPVSLHSVLSGWSFVLIMSAYLGIFNPHMGEFHGADIPVLFDFFGQTSDSIVRQFQVSMIALSITSIMGLYRLPPNSPFSRRVYFWSCASSVVQCSIIVSSNLSAGALGLFSTFNYPWMYILNGSVIITDLIFLLGLDDAISGPDDGRDSLTTESRFNMAIFYYIFFMANTAFFQMTLPPFYSNEDVWASMNLSFFEQNGLILWSLMPPVAVGILSSLGALLATLKFEKKTDTNNTPLFMFAILLVTQFDIIVQAAYQFVDKEAFSGTAMDYTNNLTEHFRIFTVANICCLLTIANAFVKRGKKESRTSAAELLDYTEE